MSQEVSKTLRLVGLAAGLLLVAIVTTPRVGSLSSFVERGQLMFPEFRDPNAAASLEVLEFDQRNGSVRPLKVQNRGGRWTIPSQHDYPTDAKDRLAKTAAALVVLKTDDVVSDNVADHERCGVIDPLDTSVPTLTGRGTRLVVRGPQDQMLADVIVGNPVDGHPGFRYVRQPNQRRIFTSNIGDLQLSADFADWIKEISSKQVKRRSTR